MDIKEHYKQHLTEHYKLLMQMSEEAALRGFSTSDMLKIIELKLDIADKLYKLESEVE